MNRPDTPLPPSTDLINNKNHVLRLLYALRISDILKHDEMSCID
jgi:hypothetical protein